MPVSATKTQAQHKSFGYDGSKLATFEILTEVSGSVWAQQAVWRHFRKLCMISLVTAYLVVVFVKDPGIIDTTRFQQLSAFLRVSVGVLLGFFITSAVTRWYTANVGFMTLFGAIRQLHTFLSGLGVPKERIHLCLRYAVVSCRCLDLTLHVEELPENLRAAYRRSHWDGMVCADPSPNWDDPSETLAKISPEERVSLEKCKDPSLGIWVWITSLITRMSQDGEIPPMASPTYGYVMGLADLAQDSIRAVNSNVGINPPYCYVQMMSMLVMSANAISAISFGLTLGISSGSFLTRLHVNPFATGDHPIKDSSFWEEVQDTGCAVVMALGAAFMYITLLEVGVVLATPFAGAHDDEEKGASAGRIPTDAYFAKLEKDLREAETMTNALPWWDAASFKPPPAPKA